MRSGRYLLSKLHLPRAVAADDAVTVKILGVVEGDGIRIMVLEVVSIKYKMTRYLDGYEYLK